MIDKVRGTIKKYNMLKPHDKVLVGLSGGMDSVVLVYSLLALKKEYSLDMLIAHLDHKFRGKESEADRKFCEALAENLGLEIVSCAIDIPKIAKEKGISPEEAARFERYDFFKRQCKIKNIKHIAVAHNKDDQAETVLMRVIRGTGTAGLGAMNPVKDMEGFIILRPLIEVTRKEIEDFIKENKLKFRHDSSNDKVIFTRNKVRKELLPYLEKNFNPNVKEVLSNMAENLRLENEFLEKFSNRKFRSISNIKNGTVSIDIKKFKKQPEAVRKRILRSALRHVKGDLRRFTYQHWKEMEDLIHNRPTHSKVDLPLGVNVIKEKKLIFVKRDDNIDI